MIAASELEDYVQALWRFLCGRYSLQERDYILKSLQSKHGGFA
jgi:hypothetical protein